MADANEIFNILVDSSSLEGEPAISRTEGEAAAAIAGLIGFAFKDHLGQVVLPQLTTDGKLPVSSDSAGVHTEDHATVTPVGVLTRTLVATATLAVDKLYKLDFLSTSSLQTVLWEIEQTDDATDTVRHKYLTGSGSFTQQISAGCLEFEAGSIGTQEINIYGTQTKGALSDMHGTICLLQIGA